MADAQTNFPRLLCACAAIAAFGLASCDLFSDPQSCPQPCEGEFICEPSAGRCQPKSLDTYRSTPPGRSLDATRVDGEIVYAAVGPESGVVVVGNASRSNAPRVVGRVDAPEEVGIAVAGGESTRWVAWQRPENGFRLAQFRNGRWYPPVTVSTADDTSFEASRHFDLVVPSPDAPGLLFRDPEATSLRYLARRGDTWQIATVDDGPPVGNRAACEPDESSERQGVGWHPDAGLTDEGLAVAYYDASCGDLRLARRVGERWSRTVVAEGDYSVGDEPVQRRGDVGRFPSLAVSPSGQIAIAYQDAGRGRLMYAAERGGSFQNRLVDPGIQVGEFAQKRRHLVGGHATLMFDAEGTPHVAYLNGSSARPVIASRLRGRWAHSTVEAEPPSGFYAELVPSADDSPTLLTEQFRHQEDELVSRLVVLRNIGL